MMVMSVCASARRTAGAAAEGASRRRAPVAGVKGTHDCRGGARMFMAHLHGSDATQVWWSQPPAAVVGTHHCCCRLFVSLPAHLQLGVVRLPEPVAAARPAVVKDVLCTPRYPGHMPGRSRPFEGHVSAAARRAGV